MKTENKCNGTVGVKRIRQDEWSRERVQNIWTDEIYIDVDGVWHTSTSEGEPNYPISKDIIFKFNQ